MSKMSVLARRSAQAATLALLVACSSDGPASTQTHNPNLARVRMSDMTLEFAYPTLQVSKDFGPVRLGDDIDLSEVKKPYGILYGHWDGPMYQLLSVNGTLNIWMDVLPWPEQARAAHGCEAKINALLEAEIESRIDLYRRGGRAGQPTIDRFKVSIRGRDGMGFRNSYNNKVSYYFPVDRDIALRLVFNSINNSGLGSDWEALSEREQARFIQSMALSGDPGDCA